MALPSTSTIEIYEARGARAAELHAAFPQRLEGESSRLKTFGAWLDGQPVGVAQIDFGGSTYATVQAVLGVTPELRRVFVRSEARCHGLGHSLVREALGLAARRHRAKVGLAVGQDNVVAQRVYADLGFAIAQDIPPFPSDKALSEDGLPVLQTNVYMVAPASMERTMSLQGAVA